MVAPLILQPQDLPKTGAKRAATRLPILGQTELEL